MKLYWAFIIVYLIILTSIISATTQPNSKAFNDNISHELIFNGLSKSNLAVKKSTFIKKPEEEKSTIIKELADTELVKTEYGRKQLKYLINCALPENTELYTAIDDKKYHFKGGMALAPEWSNRPLTPEEERWVSACIMARTNFFGVPILISMTSPIDNPPKDLIYNPENRETHSLFEGGFFGNLFLPQPVAYACTGSRSIMENNDLVLNLRLCTQPSGYTTEDNQAISYCNFIIVEDCKQKTSFTMDEVTYKEIIHTYLEPTQIYRFNP